MPLTDPRHPIGVVSERTGLSPDVLRVWERRYGVVEPRRSAGGQRLYSDADIERLALLHRATQGGHGISHVASLSKPKLESLVSEIESIAPPLPVVAAAPRATKAAIEQALAFVRAPDPSGLESLLKRSAARYGMVAFLDSIAAPFLRRVGDEWHAGRISVSEEHLATAVVQRVVSETAPLLTGSEGDPTIVIATLEGERHSAGALMAAATAASEGWRVIFLGADLPAADVAEMATRTGARAVGISIVLPERKTRLASGLREIEKALASRATLLVGGAGASALRQSIGRSDMIFVDSMSELHSRLAAMRDSPES